MNNNNCILVTFVNESSKLGVGFRTWLPKKFSKTELDAIIEEETVVLIKWPNCDVKCAKEMKTIVKSMTDGDWQTVAVKILAAGERASMMQQLSNFEKFNILNPSKKDRKELMQRKEKIETSEELNLEKLRLELKQNNKARQGIIQKSGQKMEKKILKLVEDMEHDEQNFSESDDEKDSKHDESKSANNNSLELPMTLMGEENVALRTANENLQRKLEHALREVEQLKLDKGKLRGRIDELKIALHANAEFPVYVKMTDELVKNLEDALHLSKKLPGMTSLTVDEEQKNMPSSWSPNHENENESMQSSMHFDQTQSNTTPVSQDFELKDDPMKKKIKNEKDEKDAPMKKKFPIQKEQSKGEETDLGFGVMVSKDALGKCNHSTATKLTTDLLSIVFKPLDLATKTRTGKKSSRSEENNIDKKDALCQIRLNAIQAYPRKTFPTCENVDKSFDNAVTNKCKNAAKKKKQDEKLN